MARDDGFAVADVATSYFDDEKVRQLWRRLAPDTGAMLEALGVHQSTLLASWREGRRVTVDAAAPIWLPIRESIVAELVAVGMLDRTQRVPARSWERWFGPARDRKRARVEAGRKGGLAKAEQNPSNARAVLYPSVRPSDRPSVPDRPADSKRPRARSGATARGASGPVTLADAMAATPFGQELLSRNGGRDK